MKSYLITPSAGKRLIAKALTSFNVIKDALKNKTIVIVAGTTNGYVAEEILSRINQLEGFSRKRFFRGLVLPPGQALTETGRLPDESAFPGDVVITKGNWQRGLTIFDVVDDLREGDVILKGANAVNLSSRQAGIFIGDPYGGTIGAALQALVGRRVRLIHPVGLEKRVDADLNETARKLNSPGIHGARFLPTPGEIFTEIEAISLLTGAMAQLIAGGGVNGAEGSIWLAISGSNIQMDSVDDLLRSVIDEYSFKI